MRAAGLPRQLVFADARLVYGHIRMWVFRPLLRAVPACRAYLSDGGLVLRYDDAAAGGWLARRYGCRWRETPCDKFGGRSLTFDNDPPANSGNEP